MPCHHGGCVDQHTRRIKKKGGQNYVLLSFLNLHLPLDGGLGLTRSHVHVFGAAANFGTENNATNTKTMMIMYKSTTGNINFHLTKLH